MEYRRVPHWYFSASVSPAGRGNDCQIEISAVVPAPFLFVIDLPMI